MFNINDEIISDTCFRPMITAESHFYLKQYNRYKNNTFLMGGGWLDQPNAYIQAMEIIDGQ